MEGHSDPTSTSTSRSAAAANSPQPGASAGAPPEQAAAADTQIELLEFRLAQESYAVETRYVA